MLPTRQLSGTTSKLAYLVLLRAEIARFTRLGCPVRLVSVALILSLCLAVFTGEPLAPALSYAVRTFLQCGVSTRRFRVVLAACTSDGLTGFTSLILRFGFLAIAASAALGRSYAR
jgi:hypothetical protein